MSKIQYWHHAGWYRTRAIKDDCTDLFITVRDVKLERPACNSVFGTRNENWIMLRGCLYDGQNN